jgi:hypothetical protein
MAGARDEHDPLLVERLGAHARPLVAGADQDVDLRPGEAPRCDQGVDAEHTQARAGHLRGEGRHDPRQPDHLPDVGGGEREFAIGRRRVEAGAVDRLVEIAERAPERRRQRGRARRRDDAPPAPDQQRIVERAAQTSESVADRRRRHVQPARRAHHASLCEHRVEHQQQVQIEAFKAHEL